MKYKFLSEIREISETFQIEWDFNVLRNKNLTFKMGDQEVKTEVETKENKVCSIVRKIFIQKCNLSLGFIGR